MKQRIWELDALRGFCILAMVAVHLVYDLVELYGVVNWRYPALFSFIKDWGGCVFLLISGVCVTLGRSNVRRGLLVFACGMVCTLVTLGMAHLGLAHKSIVIWFGALHCLGTCMVLWGVFRKGGNILLTALGAVMVALGIWLRQAPPVDVKWLMPLGFVYPGFASSDYFPLLPNLGFFLLGAVLGRALYHKKQTLLPRVNPDAPVPAFFRLCGKYSLWIYLLHQPILSLGIMLFTNL